MTTTSNYTHLTIRKTARNAQITTQLFATNCSSKSQFDRNNAKLNKWPIKRSLGAAIYEPHMPTKADPLNVQARKTKCRLFGVVFWAMTSRIKIIRRQLSGTAASIEHCRKIKPLIPKDKYLFHSNNTVVHKKQTKVAVG